MPVLLQDHHVSRFAVIRRIIFRKLGALREEAKDAGAVFVGRERISDSERLDVIDVGDRNTVEIPAFGQSESYAQIVVGLIIGKLPARRLRRFGAGKSADFIRDFV